ncbi:MAG: T9SS type A sorting domain-containing protein [Flavobacteriales bacterium]
MKNRIKIVVIIMFCSTCLNAQYTLNDTFADPLECTYMTRGVFVIWWDIDFDYSVEVDILLDQIIGYRSECLNDLNMMDPPGVIDGYYQNIYLHGDGGYFDSNGWGNGVGTDSNGYPFYTMPYNLFNDLITVAHEIFHLYQYNSNSPGFAYSGDSQWYIEASANWYGARQDFIAERAFIEAESLVRLPQVPFWLSYDNFPSTYSQNWQRYVHQYALALYLFYLTEEVGISPNVISEGFYMGLTETPQEYLYDQLGGIVYRNNFIDWAARMTNDFDFITENQRVANELEWLAYADSDDENEFTEIFDSNGSNGWYQPGNEDITNAWSFNTYKLENTATTSYTFDINGDANGVFGSPSYFQGKVLIKNTSGSSTFYDLSMTDDTNGSLSIDVESSDTEIYFIIASMPDYFEEINQEFQLFPYQMKITNDILGGTNFGSSDFIKVYPNPVDHSLYVSLIEYANEVDVALYSIIDQRVFGKTYFNVKEIQIDFSNISAGMYFLKVSSDTKSNTLKLFKE